MVAADGPCAAADGARSTLAADDRRRSRCFDGKLEEPFAYERALTHDELTGGDPRTAAGTSARHAS